jgi:hypothetical protein
VAVRARGAHHRGMESSAAEPLYLALALHASGGAMSGSLIDESGREHPFTGWLGLLTLLEAACTRAARVQGG